MSAKDLKLALEIAAKTTGREDIAAIGAQIETLGPISNDVEQETQALAKRMQELANQREHIAQFNQSKEALTQLELATALSSDRLEKLRQAQTLSVGGASQFAKQEKELTSEVNQLRAQLLQQASAHSLLGRALTQAGVDTTKLTSEQNRLQREIAETVNRTVQLTNSLTGAGGTVGGFTSRIGSLAGNMTALIGTYFGVQTLKDQLVAMFSAGDKSEQLGIQLKAVMGSIQGGQEATAWIKSFAKNTPLQLNEVTETFVRLKAMGLDPMDGTMQAVVDQSAKLGLGFDGVQSISLALGQAWSKGKLQGDDMLQMVERGVPVMALLEKATGKSSAELGKMSEQGLLGRDAIKALIAEMGASSAGAAADQMGTLSGLLSNLGDSWTDFKTSVANSGALDWLKSQLRQLTETITQMTNDGSLKQWARDISDSVVAVGSAIKDGVATLVDWKSQIATVGQAWLGLKIASWTASVLQFAASWKNVGAAISSASSASPLLVALSNPVVALGVALAGTTKLALDLAKAIFDLGEGQDIKNQIAERERENNQQLISQGNQLMAQNAAYSDLQYKTADAIKYMSDADRERYEQALEGNKNYIAGQLNVNAALENAGLLTDEQRQKTESATAAMRQAYADFAAGEKLHLEQASKSVSDYVADIEKAKSTAEGLANSALGDVFKTAGLDFDQISGRVGKTVQTFVDGLQKMEQATGVTGPAINAYLTKAFDSTKNQTELDALISKVDTLHNQGKLVGDDYISSLGAAANAAKSLSATNSEAGQVYINLLKQQKAAAEEAYKTTGLDQYKAKIGQLNLDLLKLTSSQQKLGSAANDVEQAYSDLGLKSATVLEAMAAKAEAAYSRISSSGSASLKQQQAAFLAFAKAEIEAATASGRLPSAMLESQASALGLTDQLTALNSQLGGTSATSASAAGNLKSMGNAAKSAGNDAGDATKNLSKMNDSVNAASSSVKSYTVMTPLFKAATLDMSKAASYMTMSMTDLNKEIETQQKLINKLSNSVAPDGFGQWINSINSASVKVYQFYEFAARAAKEIQNIQSGLSETPSEALINQAEHALIKFKDLGDENLSGLKSAIDSAKQKMDSLTDSVQSGLNSLKDELDELDANQAAIENRRYQTQLDEWQGKLAEARAAGNKETIAAANEALRIAQEVHDRKLATIKAEQDAAKSQSTTTTTSNNSPSTSSSSVTTSSESNKKITVALEGPAGTAEVTVNSESDLNNLLSVLKQHGLRTS